MAKKLSIIIFLILLCSCSIQTNDNIESTVSNTTKSQEPVETSMRSTIELKDIYTCYKWEEEHYDSRISFRSHESSGQSPHTVFWFNNGKIKISGNTGELSEWYEGTYANTQDDIYKFEVQFMCDEIWPNCSDKKKEKENLTGYFSLSNEIIYYEDNKQKKCEYGPPSYH